MSDNLGSRVTFPLHSVQQRYAASVVLTAAVVAARVALDGWLGRQHDRHLVLLPVVLVASYLGGLGPGLVSALLSTAALRYFWATSSDVPIPDLELMLYFAGSLTMCWLVDSLHRARARADAAARSRERILGIVAHDLRTPLQTIRLRAAWLLRSTLEPEAERQMKSLDRAARRMESLIRDLVDTSRIERDELALAVRDESVASIVLEAADEVASLARQKGTVLVARPPAPDALARCDRERILQVLGNLLGNALKFTPAGGTVTLGIEDVDRGLRFAVTDSGPGIRPEDAAHIFEPYWTSDRKGTGLGLFIAQSIVRAHDSRLEVSSAFGKGSTFSFTLLRVDPEPRRRSPPPSAERGLDAPVDLVRAGARLSG